MTAFNRRDVLGRMAAAALATGSAPLVSAQLAHGGPASRIPGTPPKGPKLATTLRIVIPGSQGGGWDQTGRNLATAMQSAKLVSSVQFDNKGGAAGTIGLAQFVNSAKGDPNAVLIGGMVMVGGIIRSRMHASTLSTPA